MVDMVNLCRSSGMSPDLVAKGGADVGVICCREPQAEAQAQAGVTKRSAEWRCYRHISAGSAD
jgi:hypothetical protein